MSRKIWFPRLSGIHLFACFCSDYFKLSNLQKKRDREFNMGRQVKDKTSIINNISSPLWNGSRIRVRMIEDHDTLLYSSLQSDDTSSDDCSLESGMMSLPGSRRGKSVSFGDLIIRSHEVVLGDHPSCVSGCPLELGWNHEDEKIISVEDFELQRGPRKTPSELRTTRQERQRILSKTTSDRDLKVHDRKLRRNRRLPDDLHAFFQPE